MFKRNFFKFSAFLFFILSVVSYLPANQTSLRKIDSPIPTITQVIKPLPPTATIPTQKVILPTINRMPSQPTNTPTPQPTNIPQSINVSQDIIVSLTIKGSSVGMISLPQGANQCDVLSRALSEGKIQSLNMRYDSNMGTHAVYQINGIGKENAVWWAFKVNGKSPNQGCSYIKVESGDSAQWDYLGN